MYNILLIVQILVAIGIIGLVLMQHGKGADAGAAFGGGGGGAGAASGSVFGARGAGNFLSRTTAILALAFFVNSMALAWLVSHRDGNTVSGSIMDAAIPVEKKMPTIEEVPDVPESDTAIVKGDDDNSVPEATDAASAVPDATEKNEKAEAGAEDTPEAPVPSESDASEKMKSTKE